MAWLFSNIRRKGRNVTIKEEEKKKTSQDKICSTCDWIIRGEHIDDMHPMKQPTTLPHYHITTLPHEPDQATNHITFILRRAL